MSTASYRERERRAEICRALAVAHTYARLTLAGLPGFTYRAACRGHVTPDLWFSARGSRGEAEAIEVCQGCPVVAECGAWAEARRVPFGIWGGVNRTAPAHGRRDGARTAG